MADTTVKIADLGLGDIVSFRFGDGVYDVGTVTQIADEQVTITRPYLVVGDTVTTGGLLWSVGVEGVKIGVDHPAPIVRLRKGDPGSVFRAQQAERDAAKTVIEGLKAELKISRAALKSAEEATVVLDAARKSAEQSLANVKEDLRRERIEHARERERVECFLRAAREVEAVRS